METIKGHPENVEIVFGEAIVARDESLVVLAGACGLGPPDLCWLQKAPKSALTGASGEAKGYYHCCLGVDASSSAAVAAYFATLTSLVEPPTFLQGLFSTTEMRIERGFYCCYDPLTRLDVRCELCIPGGVVCGALDCEGNVHDVTPDIWRNCVVATFLRSELYDAELVSHSAVPVARHPSLPKPADEARLLGAILGLYEDAVLPEALEALTVDQSGGVSPEHADVVLHSLLHYFAKRQRWGTAMDFFSRLLSSYPTAALYVAAVQRECGLYDEALVTLSRAVDEAPDDALLLAGLATECLYADQVEASLRYATRSARLRPQLRPAWLALARAHVRSGAGTTALVVLNLVPPPPLPGREDAMLHVVVAPEPKSVTKPTVPAYDLDVTSIRQVLAEEAVVHPAPLPSGAEGTGTAAAGGGGAAAPLSGALMVPREPPDAAPAPDTAPLRITKAVLAAVYTVLQELVAVSGWDGFLRLRSSVFVMHADSDVLREQQREAEERERQLKLLHRQLSATLPPSPGWVPQPPLAGPGPQAVNRRPPPEGVGFESALDEAVLMGLADYPEHLEDNYDDPRVVAAREAHRRHLREIAERQAKLEAAEGGAYADDEWDGSSQGSGRAGGEPRSATGRSRRKGRKTPGRGRAQAAAAAGPGVEGATPGPGAEVERQGEGRVDVLAGSEAPLMAGAEAVEPSAAASVVVAVADTREAAMLEVADGTAVPAGSNEAGGNGGEVVSQELPPSPPPPPKAQQQQQQPSSSSLGWWGTLFGGGGDAVTSAPRCKEAGPLGEACEGPRMHRVVQSREPGGEVSSCRTLAAPQPYDCRLQATPTVNRPSWPSAVRGTDDGGSDAVAGAVPAWSHVATSSALLQPTQPLPATVAAGLLDRARALQIGAVDDSWWQPAPGPGSTPAPADPVLCAPLEPLRRLPRRCGVQGVTVVLLGQAGNPQAAAEGAAAAAGCASQLRCPLDGPRVRAVARDGAAEARVGPSPLALAKGLLGLLVCKLKAQAARYRWRRRQRQLQRALLQAMALQQGLLAYRPRAPLLRLRFATCGAGGSHLPGMEDAAAMEAAASATCPRGEAGLLTTGRRRALLGVETQRPQSGASVAAYGTSGAVVACTALSATGPAGAALARLGAQHARRPHGRFLVPRRRGAGPVAEAEEDDAGGRGEAAADPAALGAVEAIAAGGGEVDVGGGAAPDDSLPLVLQNHDTDRQMVLEGLDVTGLGAKRLCARWLDELIVALWHDLQAFLDWKALDSELSEAGFRSHAEIVSGVAPGPTPADYRRPAATAGKAEGSDAEGGGSGGGLPPPPPLPSVPALEWLRRGLLAERLHHEVDALAAYQAAVMTPPPAPAAGGAGAAAVFAAAPGGGPGTFSMIAWQAILRLAPAGDPRDTAWALRAAQAVMNWLEARAPAGTTAVPFTSGFLTSAAGASGTPHAAIARSAPAAAAVAATAATGGKLHACPLPVVHCLHLVAAVLGDTGVETALQGQPGAGVKGAPTGPVGVHPAAAAVLRHAVSTATAAARSAALATPTTAWSPALGAEGFTGAEGPTGADAV